MKNKTIILTLLLITKMVLAQDVTTILNSIEKNNTKLIALRKNLEAEKLQNQTGIYLQNPEFEFHYLWGSPEVMGQRTDISLTQSVDFPQVYKHQRKIAKIKNKQVELDFIKEQKEILFETKKLLYSLISLNAKKQLLEIQLANSEKIKLSYEKKLEVGETTILEFNKAQLDYLKLSQELESVEIERLSFLNELKVLNGGKELIFEQNSFESIYLPLDFEQWYAEAEKKNPLLNWLKEEIDLSLEQIKLTKAQTLPSFQVGYMMEKATNEKFQGVVVGLSIPLWENKNTVKHAKIAHLARESYEKDSKLIFYHSLQNLFERASQLQKSTTEYKKKLALYDPTELLEKSLDKGQITLFEYLRELSDFVESQKEVLELEKELNLTVAELFKFM